MVSSIHRAERNVYRPKIGKTGIPFPRRRHLVFFYCYFRILEASRPSWSLIAVWIMTDTRCYLSTCTEYIVRGSFIWTLPPSSAMGKCNFTDRMFDISTCWISMKADELEGFKYAFGPILVRAGRAKPGNDGWRCQMYTKALLSMHTGERRLSMSKVESGDKMLHTGKIRVRLTALNR
jgi:hypothetical protein